jgi:hypothetical protein
VLSLLKFIKKILPVQKEWNILCVNDWHIGSKVLNEDLLKRVLHFVDSHRDNTRIIINGDLLHNINKHSKGAMREQSMNSQEQYDYVADLFKNYVDLIDAVVVGNHDWRTEEETDIDLLYMFCRELGIKDKYMKYRGVMGYSINKNFYSIEMFHGTGGGSTISAVENSLKKLKRTTADIMYCGHWHKEFAKPYKEHHIDPYNKQVKQYKKWMVCGNTLVDTESYAEKSGYAEGFPSQAVIKLSGEKRKRNIEVEWIR